MSTSACAHNPASLLEASAGDCPPPRSLTRRRRRLYVAVTLVVAPLLAGLLAEVACRWVFGVDAIGRTELTDDPVLFYRLKPGTCVKAATVTETINDLGMRGLDSPAFAKLPGVTRVAWVGDSACYGYGVEDNETAAAQLQDMAGLQGLAVESLNFGVPGYNALQVAAVAQQRLNVFDEIDYVVYFHHENDIANFCGFRTTAFTPFRGFWGYDRPGSTLKRVLRRSLLLNMIYEQVVFAPGGAPRSAGPNTWMPVTTTLTEAAERPMSRHTSISVDYYAERGSHYALFRRDLGRIASVARDRGARLIVVYFPTLSLNVPARSGLVAEPLRDLCTELGVTLADTTDAFAAQASSGLYTDETHPGALGHGIIAEAVLEAMIQDR